MNPTELEELLDLAADTHEIGGPPLGRLIEQGAARRRRTRSLAVGATAAATAFVVGGAFALWPDGSSSRSATDPQPTTPATSAATTPTTPTDDPLAVAPGNRLVGLNGLAVEVPYAWDVQDLTCGTAQSDTIVFDAGADGCLVLPQHPVSELHLSAADSSLIPEWVNQNRDETTIGGFQAFTSHRGIYRCASRGPGYDSQCKGTGAALSVPELGVTLWMLAPYDEAIDAVLGSARVLPVALTTVPFVALPDYAGDADQVLRHAGFDVTILDDPNADTPPFQSIDPRSGSVVPAGSVVVLSRLDPIDQLAWDWMPVRVLGEPATRDERSNGILRFDSDHSWIASDTCNDIDGVYRVRADGLIALQPRGGTLVGCSPRLGAIDSAAFAQLDRNRLTVTDAAGVEIAVYVRTAIPAGGG